MTYGRAGLAVVIALVLAAAFWPALRWRRWRRLLCLIVMTAAILLLPLLVSVEFPVQRAAVVFVCIFIAMKLYDMHHAAQAAPFLPWSAYFAFMLHPFTLVQRKLADELQPRAGANLVDLARSVVISVVSLTVSMGIWRVDFTGVPFGVEHVVKTVAFMAFIYGVVVASTAVWRLPGWRARPHLHNFFLARTPAEFWRRYSRVLGQFLHEDVFKQVGGRRSPIRATLIVFAISGLIHEYAFGIVTERLQGYQMAFFMVQGLGVVATQRAKPRGVGAMLWTIGTIAFNLAISVFFFASLNQIWPYWAEGVPAVLTRSGR